VRRTLGISAPEQFKLLLGRWDDAIFKNFADIYLAHNTELVSPFPGVVEMLKDLRAQGCKLAVLSNKPKIAGLPEMRSCGLDRLLDAWFFIEDVGLPKPDPQGVKQVQGMFAANGSASWMVGDYPVDINSARMAGTASVAALWGSASPNLTLAAKPDHVCMRPDEVAELAQRERNRGLIQSPPSAG